MPDYGHDLLFGVFVPPLAQQADAVLALAQRADEAGLDMVSVQDHPYNPQFLDTWTLLTTIAAATSRVRVFPNVANLPLRPPAILAREVATLDILSGGRAELGIGAGAFWDAIEAMGGPRRSAGESVAALREAIGVIRALWTPGRGALLNGDHYSLRGAKPGPFPVHDIGIWVGSYKERMLRLTGELADGWLPSSPYAPPEQLAGMNAIIDRAAADAGLVAARRAPLVQHLRFFLRQRVGVPPGAAQGLGRAVDRPGPGRRDQRVHPHGQRHPGDRPVCRGGRARRPGVGVGRARGLRLTSSRQGSGNDGRGNHGLRDLGRGNLERGNLGRGAWGGPDTGQRRAAQCRAAMG